jgi:DNA modification methylase
MKKFNRIINGDSNEVLKNLLNEGYRFDLILTDPPYNLFKDFGNDSDKLSIADFITINEKWLKLCKEILDDSGSIIWFAIHHNVGYLQKIMYDLGLNYRRMNIWFYENGFSRSKKSPATQYEPFLWFSNSESKWTYNVDDVRVPYKSSERLKTPVYYKISNGEKKAWIPNPIGAMRGDVWSFPTLAGKLYANEKTDHPTQKPESLITEIIKAYCPKDNNGKYSGTILDPFLGSGTLAVCCEKLNKQGHNIKWIGIELEEKWCNIAKERINNL